MTSEDDRRSQAAGRRAGPPGGRPHPGRHRASGRSRRALRREVASTVALLADGADFAAMRRYRSFAFHDHRDYLTRMQALLRSLAEECLQVSVTRFDPAAFAGYCASSGRDPDCPASRSRYTAEVAAPRLAVRYRGQSMDDLATQLAVEAARQADREYAVQVLARAASGKGAGRGSPAETAFERACAAVLCLIESAGPGPHRLVCSVPVGGRPLSGMLHLPGGGAAGPAQDDVLAFCTVLAAGIATGGRGGVVLRTCGAPGTGPDGAGRPDLIRGWSLRDGWLHPLSEAEVFNAHCTDAATGEPIPPEPGVVFAAGIRLPPPGPEPGRL